MDPVDGPSRFQLLLESEPEALAPRALARSTQGMFSRTPYINKNVTWSIRHGYRAANGTAVHFHTDWMKSHLIEGDGLLPLLYHHLFKKDKDFRSCPGARIPDTVVYERNFPRSWYVYEAKNKEIVKRAGKCLDVQHIFKVFAREPVRRGGGTGGAGRPRRAVDIVAQYMYPVQREEGNRVEVHVEFLTREGLDEFLHHRKNRPDGVLQRFLLPNGPNNAVIQAVYSNQITDRVYKRTNKFSLDDRARMPYERGVTFDGPAHLSDESNLSEQIRADVLRLCQNIASHFLTTEHKPISRMCLYFKLDETDQLWFLWGSSLRIGGTRFAPSTMRIPLNLATHFVATDLNSTRRNERAHREDVEIVQDDVRMYRLTHDIAFPSYHDVHGSAAARSSRRHESPTQGTPLCETEILGPSHSAITAPPHTSVPWQGHVASGPDRLSTAHTATTPPPPSSSSSLQWLPMTTAGGSAVRRELPPSSNALEVGSTTTATCRGYMIPRRTHQGHPTAEMAEGTSLPVLPLRRGPFLYRGEVITPRNPFHPILLDRTVEAPLQNGLCSARSTSSHRSYHTSGPAAPLRSNPPHSSRTAPEYDGVMEVRVDHPQLLQFVQGSPRRGLSAVRTTARRSSAGGRGAFSKRGPCPPKKGGGRGARPRPGPSENRPHLEPHHSSSLLLLGTEHADVREPGSDHDPAREVQATNQSHAPPPPHCEPVPLPGTVIPNALVDTSGTEPDQLHSNGAPHQRPVPPLPCLLEWVAHHGTASHRAEVTADHARREFATDLVYALYSEDLAYDPKTRAGDFAHLLIKSEQCGVRPQKPASSGRPAQSAGAAPTEQAPILRWEAVHQTGGMIPIPEDVRVLMSGDEWCAFESVVGVERVVVASDTRTFLKYADRAGLFDSQGSIPKYQRMRNVERFLDDILRKHLEALNIKSDADG